MILSDAGRKVNVCMNNTRIYKRIKKPNRYGYLNLKIGKNI